MKWYERLWRTPARKFLFIGVLIASGVGAPLAISIGTGLDEGVSEIEQAIEESE